MMIKRDRDRVKGHGWLVFLFILGLLLLIYPHVDLLLNQETFSNGLEMFLGNMGGSLLVGVVLVYSLERVTRKRQQQENRQFIEDVNKNVLASVYKRVIPESAFREVEDTLLNARVERTNYEISMVLKELIEEAGAEKIDGIDVNNHYLVHMHSSYVIRNLSGSKREHKIVFGVEVPIEKQLERFVDIDSFCIEGKERRAGDEQENMGANVEVAETIVLEPYGQVVVKMSGTTVKRKIDSEVWASIVPSDGVVVRIEAPTDIELHCRANHSKSIVKCDSHSAKVERVWKLEHGILPYQSIIVWWNGLNR